VELLSHPFTSATAQDETSVSPSLQSTALHEQLGGVLDVAALKQQ